MTLCCTYMVNMTPSPKPTQRICWSAVNRGKKNRSLTPNQRFSSGGAFCVSQRGRAHLGAALCVCVRVRVVIPPFMDAGLRLLVQIRPTIRDRIYRGGGRSTQQKKKEIPRTRTHLPLAVIDCLTTFIAGRCGRSAIIDLVDFFDSDSVYSEGI